MKKYNVVAELNVLRSQYADMGMSVDESDENSLVLTEDHTRNLQDAQKSFSDWSASHNYQVNNGCTSI